MVAVDTAVCLVARQVSSVVPLGLGSFLLHFPALKVLGYIHGVPPGRIPAGFGRTGAPGGGEVPAWER
jgi:hypothetical protein